ncbi:MAG: hypothetical protein A2136_05445 [Chloroflexi bacterium RBG_16_54_11]|nr:MAG: hypothetical protein A2136_05445 [Chloroflexi bacterium RBG_16_54_11]
MEETSGALRWAWARLDSVSGQNSQRTPLYIPMAITFLVISQVWNGEEHGWYFDDGHYFDEGLYFNAGLSYVLSSNPMTITVPNSGNVDVENPSITITAKSSNITALTLKRIVGGVTQEHLEYTGTILVDDDLVIDCGSYSVENDGVGDSAHFSRGADHKYDGWMKLEPGNNPIQITRTGGGFDSIADFNFNDAHA